MADEFRQSSAPFFRQTDTQQWAVAHRISALCMLLIFPLIHYGGRVILMVLFGVLSAVGAEALWHYASGRPQQTADLTAVETGLTCALLMPACAHYQLVIFTSAAAVLIGSKPFGGTYRTPFVPAAVGYCLAAVCFPDETFTYSRLNENVTDPLAAFGSNDTLSAAYSQLALLRQGRDPFTHLNEYLLAEVAGPIGTTSVVLLVIAAVWLLVGGGLAWQCLVSFSLAGAVVSFGLPYQTAGSLIYVFYDLLGGSTFFCCVFMVCRPHYCPKLATARYLWGGACGLLAVLIQHFGSTEAGGAFAVLMLAPLAGAFDRTVWHLRSRDISYSSIKKRLAKKLQYRMKTQQERELDAFKEQQEHESDPFRKQP